MANCNEIKEAHIMRADKSINDVLQHMRPFEGKVKAIKLEEIPQEAIITAGGDPYHSTVPYTMMVLDIGDKYLHLGTHSDYASIYKPGQVIRGLYAPKPCCEDGKYPWIREKSLMEPDKTVVYYGAHMLH